MSIIKLLDSNTINKIAAGEVVERPSSVVKELCENAIDAKASAITVEIKEGGLTLIKISDNGKGIEKNQAKTAFLRHATSKIEKIDDLDNIYSLGFRGEALATIAAISQVEMITKTFEQEIGYKIEISGGNIISAEDCAATTGTVISVKNIFFNVPARRKFLKKATTESGYIADVINKIALSHPEISIKYINNGNTMLHTSGNNDLQTGIYHVYGKDTSQKMIEINNISGSLKIDGLIGKPEISRGNRNYENLFINGRFVKNETVSQAIEDAYKTRLVVGKFPVFVLSLTLNADMVDVNVHPAKLEVRFKDEDMIYDFVYTSVFKALKQLVLIPEADWDSKPSPKAKEFIEKQVQPINTPLIKDIQQTINEEILTSADNKVTYTKPAVSYDELQKLYKSEFVSDKIKGNKNRIEEKKLSYIPQVDESKVQAKEENQVNEIKKSFFNDYKIVGQIFSTYWVIEQGNSIYMIDQHAAHERILFEEIYEKFKNNRAVSQRLLQPLILNLSEKEKDLLENNIDLMSGFGFEIEGFVNGEYALKSVPYVFKNPENLDFFNEILDTMNNNSINNIYDMKAHAIATIACKAAVKANDKLSIQEAVNMIQKLLELENPFNCPHGRPTTIELTKYELEKKFKRIQ